MGLIKPNDILKLEIISAHELEIKVILKMKIKKI